MQACFLVFYDEELINDCIFVAPAIMKKVERALLDELVSYKLEHT